MLRWLNDQSTYSFVLLCNCVYVYIVILKMQLQMNKTPKHIPRLLQIISKPSLRTLLAQALALVLSLSYRVVLSTNGKMKPLDKVGGL